MQVIILRPSRRPALISLGLERLMRLIVPSSAEVMAAYFSSPPPVISKPVAELSLTSCVICPVVGLKILINLVSFLTKAQEPESLTSWLAEGFKASDGGNSLSCGGLFIRIPLWALRQSILNTVPLLRL